MCEIVPICVGFLVLFVWAFDVWIALSTFSLFRDICVCVHLFFKFFFIIYLNSSQYIASDNT